MSQYLIMWLCLVIINDKVLGEHVLMRVRSILDWSLWRASPRINGLGTLWHAPSTLRGDFLPARGVALYRCSVELSIGFGTLYCFDHSPRIYPIMNVFRLFVPSRIYPFMKVFVFFVSSRIYPFMNVWESYGCYPILDSCVSYGGFPIIKILFCLTDLSDH